jgi:hypothetical protein
MKKIHSILIIFLVAFSVTQTIAQEDCSVILREAQDTYDAGNLDAVLEMIYPCLESGFNKTEKAQAYRLITLTFLYDDKMGPARAAMYELLKLDPEFEYNEVIDPIEFKELHESFNTYPIYSFGLNGGGNISNVNLLETYGVDKHSNAGTYLSDGVGYQFGVNGARIIIPKLYVNVGLLFKGTKLIYNNTFEFNSLVSSPDTLNSLGDISAKENHSWLSIPLSFTYDLPIKGKVSSYLSAGFTTGFLLSSKSTFSRTYNEKYSLPDVSGVPLDMKVNRNTTNYWLTGGAGIKYKVTKGNLFIDVKYNHGLRLINNQSNRYNNPELLYQYYYIDDDFKLNDLAISIGYTRHFYNPSLKDKIKRAEMKKNSDSKTSSVDSESSVKPKKSKAKGTKYKKFKQ